MSVSSQPIGAADELAIFAAKLRLHRALHGLNQESLARACGVSRPTVISWEKGRAAPDVLSAVALARLLGFSLDALFGLTSAPDRAGIQAIRTLQAEKIRAHANQLLLDADRIERGEEEPGEVVL